MIYELNQNDCEIVRPLFKELEYNLITSAVIERTSPGRIYVDNTANPKTAFMCTVEGYYLAGYENNNRFNRSLNKLINEKTFAGDTVRKNETAIFISFHPDSWESKMEAIFKGRSPLRAVRRHHVCTELKASNWKEQIPEGFSMRRIDRRLLGKPGLKIPDHVTDWMEINWGSIHDFMEKGFGFCMLHGKEVVSWSIADCVSGNACEIGIHTRQDYRRRGLATLTAAAAIDYCLSHGFTSVGWHCDEHNLGSRGVAEKVGFELERRYVQCYVCFNEAHHLAETGLAHFRAKRYREAVECYEGVFATKRRDMPDWMPAELHLYYHLVARAKAAIGENDAAIKYLEKAIDNGRIHIDFTENYEEFNSLRETQEWKELMTKLEKKSSRSK
ncbi:MAG: GNAT family N-acetyltransferase [Candidatus Bathyarchaeota archaeon]|nr:GNAT family N-acetyltransferase [Candidatus Bathyarchaeota archaeon]